MPTPTVARILILKNGGSFGYYLWNEEEERYFRTDGKLYTNSPVWYKTPESARTAAHAAGYQVQEPKKCLPQQQ